MQFWPVSLQNRLKMCAFLRGTTWATGSCNRFFYFQRGCNRNRKIGPNRSSLVRFRSFFWLHGPDLHTLFHTIHIISHSQKIHCDSTRPICARRSNKCEYDLFQNEEDQISVLVHVNDLAKSTMLPLQMGQPTSFTVQMNFWSNNWTPTSQISCADIFSFSDRTENMVGEDAYHM